MRKGKISALMGSHIPELFGQAREKKEHGKKVERGEQHSAIRRGHSALPTYRSQILAMLIKNIKTRFSSFRHVLVLSVIGVFREFVY
jgi:hypothetical protein